MSPHEIFSTLITWTPFLAGGFVSNIAISFTSMVVGTILGGLLIVMRASAIDAIKRAGFGLSMVSRNVPTFVLIFYLAFLIPVEFQIGSQLYAFEAWIKASMALAVAVTGFVADNGSTALANWHAGHRSKSMLFIPSWSTYFLMTTMASTTGSVIGVDEIVSRSNAVIGAVGKPEIMLWVYLYTMLWFMLFCFPLSVILRRLKVRLTSSVSS